MLELIVIGDVFESPKGIVLAGTNNNLNNITVDIIAKILLNIDSVFYVDRNRISRHYQVLETQFNFSVRNNFNFFFMIDESSVKNTPEENEVIYCQENEELTKILRNRK